MDEAANLGIEVWEETNISLEEIQPKMNICITISVAGMPSPKPTCGTVTKAEDNGDSMIVALENPTKVFVLFHTPPPKNTYTIVHRTLKSN